MNWDYHIDNDDDVPVFYVKRLLGIGGWHVDLHKMVKADNPGCFHTHPAYAIRVILWGGYWEQVVTGETHDGHMLEKYERRPGFIGLVRPELKHHISWLRNKKSSYSLWLRGPVIAKVEFGCD